MSLLVETKECLGESPTIQEDHEKAKDQVDRPKAQYPPYYWAYNKAETKQRKKENGKAYM